MTEKELGLKTKKELMEICKEKGLPRYKGKTTLTKQEMIKNIMADVDIQSDIDKAINECVETHNDSKTEKMNYIETIQIGVLVAFRNKDRNGKLDTAKVINKSSKRRMLKVETSYGKQHELSYDDIIWVKTGLRWPKGIYLELKGITNEENR